MQNQENPKETQHTMKIQTIKNGLRRPSVDVDVFVTTHLN